MVVFFHETATFFDLGVSDPDGGSWDGTFRLPPSQDNFAFIDALSALWISMVNEFKPKRILKVGVNLHGLVRSVDITPDLFTSSSTVCQLVQEKRDALTAAMDKVNKRFGADSVQLGVVPPTQAGFVGTKISYTRIPKLSEFYE